MTRPLRKAHAAIWMVLPILLAVLFVAHGPAFRPGVTLEPFDNVDVYPLLAKLLGLRPEPNDGHLSGVSAGLR